MKSNYRKIGDFIELIDERNQELRVKTLLGLSITKEFIPSVANIVGTDMANYKIIRKNQFACSIMQVRRDKKMPVALLEKYDEAIISQAYPVFKIVDEAALLPEYLMMWMRRPEFDRHACFLAVGGVRGSLEWEDFLEMELPVPHIDKQREIVKEYNTIVNRIKLNEQLNQKLEETAQAMYKHWFVDFEFPISAAYAAEVGKPELEALPYKSNGGEMVYNEELDQEIPKGWQIIDAKDYGETITGKTPSSNYPQDFGEYLPFITPGEFRNYFKFIKTAGRYLSKTGSKKLSTKILSGKSLMVTCIGSDMGKVAVNDDKCITNQQINSIIPNKIYSISFLYYYFKSIYGDLRNMATGSSTMLMINKTEFELIRVLKPGELALLKFHEDVSLLDRKLLVNCNQESKLKKLKELVLSKMTQEKVDEIAEVA